MVKKVKRSLSMDKRISTHVYKNKEPDENFSEAFNRLFLPCTLKHSRSDAQLLIKLVKSFVDSGVQIKLHPHEIERVKELIKK